MTRAMPAIIHTSQGCFHPRTFFENTGLKCIYMLQWSFFKPCLDPQLGQSAGLSQPLSLVFFIAAFGAVD